MKTPRAVQWIKAGEGARSMICLVCDKEYDLRAKFCGLDQAALVPLREHTPFRELQKTYQDLHELWPPSGRSILFRGMDSKNERQVVIKCLSLKSKRFRDFRRQAQLLSSLNHKSIIPFIEHGELEDGTPFYVTEYFHGENLDVAFRNPPVERFRSVFASVADALHYAHEQNVFHGDLKPADILVDPYNNVRILDFGKGMPWIHGQNIVQQATEHGDVFGDPAYVAPETCRGEVIGTRSNVYSLGCIMYNCLQGHPPIEADTWMLAAVNKMYGKPTPLRPEIDEKVPRQLKELIFQCLSVDPNDRPTSMSKVKERIIDA